MEKGSQLIAFPFLAGKFAEEKGEHAWKRMGQLCVSGLYFVLLIVIWIYISIVWGDASFREKNEVYKQLTMFGDLHFNI